MVYGVGKGVNDLVGGSKGGTDIAASVPGYLRMIFEIQQKLFLPSDYRLVAVWVGDLPFSNSESIEKCSLRRF